jgi:hypothetical protein
VAKRSPNAKPMICCTCGARIVATLDQAQRHGWKLWVGGGQCRRCKDDPVSGMIEVLTEGAAGRRGSEG